MATVDDYLDMRAKALAMGDFNLAREIEHQLARLGWQPEDTEYRAPEVAVPAKPVRKRAPKKAVSG